MKKLLMLGCLVAVSQNVFAGPVKIINGTPFGIQAVIGYAACSDDGGYVAPNSRAQFQNKPLCAINSVRAEIREEITGNIKKIDLTQKKYTHNRLTKGGANYDTYIISGPEMGDDGQTLYYVSRYPDDKG